MLFSKRAIALLTFHMLFSRRAIALLTSHVIFSSSAGEPHFPNRVRCLSDSVVNKLILHMSSQFSDRQVKSCVLT